MSVGSATTLVRETGLAIGIATIGEVGSDGVPVGRSTSALGGVSHVVDASTTTFTQVPAATKV